MVWRGVTISLRGRHDARRVEGRCVARAGFTLLELLVVGCVGTLALALICNVARWYARSVDEMNVESQLDRELRAATNAVADEFGRAIAVRTNDGDDVQFDIDTNDDGVAQWGSPDDVVTYSVAGGLLVRHAALDDSTVKVARQFTSVSSTLDVANSALNVQFDVTYRQTTRSIGLSIQDP